ncbi:TrkA C-terminal domain-containing protein [Haloplanus rubicundus]|uniref:TrkA C-terminal domain-containing protein n=1 Tax=Haloplanus rubicundus TaxID=1547898 RepID=UPI0021CB2211|nr:TrkA C-terminal domain-containing protein [Haloplanus rubicundus]
MHRRSQLVGTTLAESGIREWAGVNVIGAWFRSEFETSPDPDVMLTNGTVLLATDREAQLARLKDLTRSGMRRPNRSDTVVVGHAEIGRTVTDALTHAGVQCTVVDRTDLEGVDVVGDATELKSLRGTGIGDTSAAILVLPRTRPPSSGHSWLGTQTPTRTSSPNSRSHRESPKCTRRGRTHDRRNRRGVQRFTELYA